MKVTLIKDEDGYNLMISGRTFATTDFRGVHPSANSATEHKLSIKNCQAIENGYDLEELSENVYREYPTESKNSGLEYNRDRHVFKKRKAFIKGFEKCLEILGDKKFSEKELTMLFAYGHQIGMNNVLAIQSQHSPQPMSKPDSDKLRDELIQYLQQTEFDVEICCYVDNSNGWLDADSFNSPLLTNTGIPKLDADGCIVLKRK